MCVIAGGFGGGGGGGGLFEQTSAPPPRIPHVPLGKIVIPDWKTM